MMNLKMFSRPWLVFSVIMLAVLLAAIILIPVYQKQRQPSYDREWYRKQVDSIDQEMKRKGFVKVGNAWQLPDDKTKAASTNTCPQK